jgi:N-acetylmuramoyl-L-alanine amidase
MNRFNFLTLIFLIVIPILTWADDVSNFKATRSILTHFGVQDEPDTQKYFDDLQGQTTLRDIASRIKYFDLNDSFKSYFTFAHSEDGTLLLQAYQDKNSKKIIDYTVKLSSSKNKIAEIESFRSRILEAQKNSGDLPLAGLKIALDPGHMGTKYWDRETGKYVKDEHGKWLSEGLLVLQTALLLEEQLKKLGAEVLLTRRELAPVSELPYKGFDLRPFQLHTLLESTSQDWFESLVLKNSNDNDVLFEKISSSDKYKRIFKEFMRWHYFILDEDLNARVKLIKNFSPDITLIIHMDTSDLPENPTGVNTKVVDGTKAYVVGGFKKDEFASREDRRFFGTNLLDKYTWNASVLLSHSILSQIHEQLQIPFDSRTGEDAALIEPGIQARNLYIPRKLNSSAVSYIECLYYNDPKEFSALTEQNHVMTISGIEYSYSNRLVSLAGALSAGIVDFVKNYK